MNTALHKILVVGGGAGGLELATHLGRQLGLKRLARPALLDCNPTHIWKPLLHEVATGSLNTGEDEVNYFAHGHRNGYEFELGGMIGLDRDRRTVKVGPILDSDDGSCILPAREVQYDTLVIAVGSVTNDFGTPGVSQHCLCLNTPKEAEVLRRRILIQALKVVMGTSKSPKVRIGIAGAGATGVELAAEIHHTMCELRHYGANIFEDQLQVTIVEGSNRILGGGPESLSKFATSELKKRNVDVKTNCRITSVNEEGFVLQDGTLLPVDLKIWTAGIKAPDWLGKVGLTVNHVNQIEVDEKLQSLEDPNIMAMGDCAHAPDGKSGHYLPATAQVANQQAKWISTRLARRLKNESSSPFVFEPKGMLVSLGESTAVGSLAAIVGPKRDYYVEGIGAKFLYASLYRMHQAVLYGWTRAGFLWFGDKLRHVALPQLKLH